MRFTHEIDTGCGCYFLWATFDERGGCCIIENPASSDILDGFKRIEKAVMGAWLREATQLWPDDVTV